MPILSSFHQLAGNLRGSLLEFFYFVVDVLGCGGVLLQKLLQRSWGVVGEVRKLDNVSSSKGEVRGIITHLLGGTLLGSSNVYLITLETSNLLVDGGKNPGTLAKSG